jgi:hypothetical protein
VLGAASELTSTQSLLVYSRCALGMLPRLCVHPALFGLCCELAGPVCTEDLELLLGRERDSHPVRIPYLFNDGQKVLGPGSPPLQQSVLAPEMVPDARVRVGQHRRDLFESEVQLSVERTRFRPGTSSATTACSPPLSDSSGNKADGVAVLQGPHRDTRQPG